MSLERAMARPGARFIFEIKRASPSEGAIRGDASATAIARVYEGVADALSVLTDGPRFQGSLADLAEARRVFSGPVLAKDFFLDPRQVVEARLHGADAVLVMLSLLGDAEARAIMTEARRFGMDALLEVHDEGEMRRAHALGSTFIGINNRDFRDLSVDLNTTRRLASIAGGRTLISESGISSRADVESLAPLVDAFLVGTSVMRAGDPAGTARALAFGQVKACGLNRVEDIAAARAAAFAGLIFVESSPRFVTRALAEPLAAAARDYGIKPVGVFRDQPAETISAIASELHLAAVQLHGREDAATIALLRRSLPEDCEIWSAVDASADIGPRGGDRLLFDNGAGGSGQCFDWRRVADHPQLGQAILAGGIGPANARAAAAVGAFAIDVGSGVDERPGLKSAEKIARLFDALRPASRQELAQCA
jgi:indole-3-glycerol phosphate synthase/phosphoribosylanthranilate isomerase